MKTVRVFIERSKDGSYGAYMPDDNNLSYGVIGNGATAAEAIADFKAAYEDMKTFLREEGKPFEEIDFIFSGETVTQTRILVNDVKAKMSDILTAVSWREIARTYFGKSSSWLYHKLDGIDGNGGSGGFTVDETAQLKGALCDLSDRIRRAADSI